MSKEKYFARMEKKDWLPLICRSIAGTISFFTVSLAVKNLPLTLFQILYNTLPFMIAIIVFIWLCERISKFEFAAMCFCFSGIILVAIYAPEQEAEVDETGEKEDTSYSFGITMALVTTFLYAVAGVVARRLRAVHFTVIQFHYSFIGTVLFTIYNIIL